MITPAPPDAASARARTKLPEVAVMAWPLALAMSGSPLLTAAPVTSLVMPRMGEARHLRVPRQLRKKVAEQIKPLWIAAHAGGARDRTGDSSNGRVCRADF